MPDGPTIEITPAEVLRSVPVADAIQSRFLVQSHFGDRAFDPADRQLHLNPNQARQAVARFQPDFTDLSRASMNEAGEKYAGKPFDLVYGEWQNNFLVSVGADSDKRTLVQTLLDLPESHIPSAGDVNRLYELYRFRPGEISRRLMADYFRRLLTVCPTPADFSAHRQEIVWLSQMLYGDKVLGTIIAENADITSRQRNVEAATTLEKLIHSDQPETAVVNNPSGEAAKLLKEYLRLRGAKSTPESDLTAPLTVTPEVSTLPEDPYAALLTLAGEPIPDQNTTTYQPISVNPTTPPEPPIPSPVSQPQMILAPETETPNNLTDPAVLLDESVKLPFSKKVAAAFHPLRVFAGKTERFANQVIEKQEHIARQMIKAGEELPSWIPVLPAWLKFMGNQQMLWHSLTERDPRTGHFLPAKERWEKMKGFGADMLVNQFKSATDAITLVALVGVGPLSGPAEAVKVTEAVGKTKAILTGLTGDEAETTMVELFPQLLKTAGQYCGKPITKHSLSVTAAFFDKAFGIATVKETTIAQLKNNPQWQNLKSQLTAALADEPDQKTKDAVFEVIAKATATR
ncbi:hypothetical protein M1523_02080 [Patescibacteria group bacterium]|nr:hypothetical protein [Patescibacteria group bacterium]MCL5092000.1 hypothetical protein [Patescibacteria group bacterium]